jgi:hypothetical protein
LRKRIILIGVVRLINQNTAAYFGGAVAKKAFTMKDAKLENISQEILVMMRFKMKRLICH